MDLIYMNHEKEDQGVLIDYIFDLAIGKDENDFECTVALDRHCCNGGFYLYIEKTEYGGIIDKIKIDTEKQKAIYSGRTWHGILSSKIVVPDSGLAYLTVSGEANSVLGMLIIRLGLSDLFEACNENSNFYISNYNMNRYIDGYSAFIKMLKTVNAKLSVSFQNLKVRLSAVPIVDYSQDEQIDSTQISLIVEKNFHPTNHMICLGKGELENREITHLYTDGNGNITDIQNYFGIDEVVDTYDNANAESLEELKRGGVERLRESWNADILEFNFLGNEESYGLGDLVGAKEQVTGITVSESINKKIVTIMNGRTQISYKVGE